MERITCVHQGFELYGSDRCFIETVSTIRSLYPGARIDVVLPRHGPIVAALTAAVECRVIVEPLWILRRRDLARLATLGLLALPGALARALARIRDSDLVYVNTAVVADYLIAARLARGRCVVHVHEIAGGAVRAVLRSLILWSGASVVCNSLATRAAYALPDEVPARVVYNGIAGPARVAARDAVLAYDGARPLRVLVLGRISPIKGQTEIVEAVASLPAALRERIALRIVGNAYEDEARERALAAQIAAAGLSDRIAMEPFVADPTPLYRWADIVAMPSQRPESLGRVAIEAMSHGLPPLVTRIGGLPEVVEDGVTGWVVPPTGAAPIAAALTRILAEPAAWRDFGAAARGRYERLFSEESAAAGIAAVLAPILGPHAPGADTARQAQG